MRKQVETLVVGLVVAFLVGSLTLSSLVSSPLPVYAAPAATTSRYLKTTDQNTLDSEGCQQTNESGVIVLAFGQPWFDGTNYGTTIFGSNTFRSVSTIETAVKEWLNGYWVCGGSGVVSLAIGTSNYRGSTTYGHGQAWAQMVNRIENWIVSPPSWGSRESVHGADDIELDWNSVSNSRAWIQGYSDVGGTYYDTGDAAGCPPFGGCDNGWTLEDVWYKSWGALPAYPVPEIYNTDGSTAQEWYQVSLYGYTHHGGAVPILATLTQWAAAGNCCTNQPAQGWQQMYDALNSDSRTANYIQYSTDITWAN
jgi:hypothetical protein